MAVIVLTLLTILSGKIWNDSLMIRSLVVVNIVSSIHNESKPEINRVRANQTLHRLINLVPIDSLVLHIPRVNRNTTYGIVLLVISSVNKRNERQEIRRTWASLNASKMLETGSSIVIFLVGRSSELEEEAATYSDLLQLDIEDTYRNLVYKVEAGFRWLNSKIFSEFVAKIDSDTAVHIDRLYGRLKKYEKERGSKDWIECKTLIEQIPYRNTSSPWYVAKEDYPLEHFPTFCSGPAYVLRRVTFEKMISRMKNYMIVEAEDVFFTGIVAKDFAVHFDEGVVTIPFTELSSCDSNGPVLSILNTHLFRENTKPRLNLTSAWELLKSPVCDNGIE